jgi:hypothetical protein
MRPQLMFFLLLFFSQTKLNEILCSGGNRTVWASDSAAATTLDASASFDPDVSPGTTSTLTYSWVCTRPVTLRACGTWEQSASAQLKLPVGFFSATDVTETYSFVVTVTSGTRSATSSAVYISAMAVALPTLSINISVPTQGPQWLRITPSDIVSFSAAVELGSAISSSTVYLQWTCLSGGVNMTAGSASLLSSPTSSTLILAPNVLTAGTTYTFQLAARLSTSASEAGLASATITVNSIPTGGTCSVSPSQGVAIQTKFTFACAGWLDDAGNLPLTYGVRQVDSTGALLNIVQAQQSNSQFSMYLPVGAPLLLRVSVLDIWGGQAVVSLSVNVSAPDASSSAALQSVATSALASLQQASNAGDVNAAIQLVLPLTQIIQASGASMYASSSADALQQRSDIRTQIFSTVLSMATTVTTRSDSALATSQVMNLIAAVVSVPDEMTTAVTTQASTFLTQALANTLNSSSVPFRFVRGLIAILFVSKFNIVRFVSVIAWCWIR